MQLELPKGAGAFYSNDRVAKLPFYSRISKSVEVDSSFYRALLKVNGCRVDQGDRPGFQVLLRTPRP